MNGTEETDSSPGAEIADTLRPGPDARQLPVSPAGQLLMNFLEAMNAAGDEAEAAYKEAVSALRERADDVVVEIARQENRCRTRDYSTRWGLIYAASELEHPTSLPFFRSVVLTPIPPEESDDPHSFSTVAEETILRTTAVDGVARLAAEGNREAVEALLAFLSVPSFSVKRAAVQGLLAVRQGESLRDRIEERLCPEDRFLLEIRPLDVRRATQIDNPEADLSEEGRTAVKERPPDLPDRAPRAGSCDTDASPSAEGGAATKRD
jgi:HEAT repeat protein